MVLFPISFCEPSTIPAGTLKGNLLHDKVTGIAPNKTSRCELLSFSRLSTVLRLSYAVRIISIAKRDNVDHLKLLMRVIIRTNNRRRIDCLGLQQHESSILLSEF